MVLCGEVTEKDFCLLIISRESVTFNCLVNSFLFTLTSPLLGLRYPI